jgi:hypothetical protein
LRWIAQKQVDQHPQQQSTVACPACGYVYRLREKFDFIRSGVGVVNRFLDSIVPVLSLAGATFSFYIAFSAYGGK